MRILKFNYALLAVTAVLIGTTSVHAQTTTTETLTFDNNNQLPSGWGYWYNVGAVGANVSIQNQRLEIGQVDSAGGITRSFDSTGVSQVKIEYDGNLANVFWGQWTTATLFANTMATTVVSDGYVSSTMGKSGYGLNSMAFAVDYMATPVAGGGYSRIYENLVDPAVFDNYHVSSVFQDGQVSQTATNLTTGATFSSGVVSLPGFTLASMHNMTLSGGTTTGESAWIDNVTVTVTAVPEPETYAMLLAGLGLVGAVSRRRRTP